MKKLIFGVLLLAPLLAISCNTENSGNNREDNYVDTAEADPGLDSGEWETNDPTAADTVAVDTSRMTNPQ